MHRLRRAAALALAGGMAVGLALAVPAAAQAGTGGHRLQTQKFTISFTDDQPGIVIAAGPVRGRGLDYESQTDPSKAVFVFKKGTVNVWHDAVGQNPKVDPRSCTIYDVETGSWKFTGGTGKYRHVFGFGRFRFTLFATFRVIRKHHHRACDLKDGPEHQSIFVTAWGQSTLGQHGHGLAA